ncbi:MAG: glycine-rich protein [Actinobacteria bacterium]|nr:glycine-rich protein [Actinomycetota bacterium]
MNAKVRFSIASLAAAVSAMGLVTATASGAGASLPASKSFTYTGANQQYSVPAGVCGVRIEVEGAAGGWNYYFTVGGHGGTGSAEIAVQPNDVLTVVVGGRGSYRLNQQSPTWYPGGFGGGGQQTIDIMSGGGGGATSVLSGSAPLLIAGGGGGSGYQASGSGGNGGDVGNP